jgi:hypothetical protein
MRCADMVRPVEQRVLTDARMGMNGLVPTVNLSKRNDKEQKR